jgi:lactoylglutathione lyase
MFTEMFPIVATPDLQRALGFYRDLLDGKVTYQFPPEGDPGYVSLEIGSSHLGVAQPPDGEVKAAGPISLWVYAEDVDAAVERLRAAGVRITVEPEVQPWGEKVAHVLDPDGNEVLLGEPAPEG